MTSRIPTRSAASSASKPFTKPAPWILGVLLALAAAVAYSNSFNAAFHFDDRIRIEENFAIRALWPISVPIADTTRPVCMFTFAVNYALHGYDVWGYHVVNLTIHIAAGLTLFGIVRRTLSRGTLTPTYRVSATPLAFTIALIWTLHPLNTEAVTYIVQRLESLMGLCYLATLYCFIRAQDAPRKTPWYAASIVCCALGMGTKEVMVTAPLMVLWYDRVFAASSWRSLWRERRGYYACLASTWFVLAWCMWRWQEDFEIGMIGKVKGLTPLSYLLSQAGVITHYLRLSFWPFGLCLDYGWPVAQTAHEILPPLILVGSLFVATVWAVFRRPAWGFVGGWFFCVLAPTSSIVPINDLAFEHRMYLALAAVVIASVLSANSILDWMANFNTLLKRRMPFLKRVLATIVVAQMAILSWGRNEVYHSKLGLWEDTVRQAPGNARAHGNLAAELRIHGRLDESFDHCQQAIKLDPDSADAQTDYGVALMDRGDIETSVGHHRRALEIKPNHHLAHCNLAVSLWKLGRRKEAMGEFEKAEKLAPSSADIRSNFAKALAEGGSTDQALGYYKIALEIRPNDPSIHYNAGVALQDAGRFDEAAQHYRQAIRLAPDLEQAHNNLGITLIALGKIDEAILHFSKAVELAPGLAAAQQNLGHAYADRGQVDNAIEHLQKALEIQPDLPTAAARLKSLSAGRKR